MPIKIALADDHIMVLDGLRNALASEPDIVILGCYRTGAALMEALGKGMSPDVLLLDLQLPDKTGQEIAVEVMRHYPGTRILILSGVDSSMVIQDMMEVGCKGYLLKTMTDKDLLVLAIQSVYNGKIFLEPSIRERLLEGMLEAKQKPAMTKRKLTARERDVLQLIAMEFTNQQIADRLFISLRTVENHRHNLIQKLEVKNGLGLIKAAMEMGLIKE